MRIVLAIGSIQGGGAERVASILANAWADCGHHVTILTFEPEDAVPAYFISESVEVMRLDLNKPVSSKLGAIMRVWNSILTLRVTIRTLDPDVVVSFIDQVNILIILACKGLGLPVIISERVHPGYFKIGWFWNCLRRLTYGRATALVVQTREIEAWCKARFSTEICVIPNPVRRPQDKRINSMNGRSTVVAAGRLMHQKGFDLLVNAFAKVADAFPEWDLVVYGEGEDRSMLEGLIQKHGLQDRVSFPGWVGDLAEKLRQTDIFCLSSRFEGFPNVLCEAMSLGLPVVATNCSSGPADIITDGVDGVLVPSEDETALAQGLRHLMEDESLRSRLGGNAMTISERYALDKIVAAWDECMAQYRI